MYSKEEVEAVEQIKKDGILEEVINTSRKQRRWQAAFFFIPKADKTKRSILDLSHLVKATYKKPFTMNPYFAKLP